MTPRRPDADAPATLVVPARAGGERLDRFLAMAVPDASRRRLMELVKAGRVYLDGRRAKPGERVTVGQTVTLPPRDELAATAARTPPPPPRPSGTPPREALPRAGPRVEVIHRDDDLLVVCKPPGVPCHGGAGLGVKRTLLELLKDDVVAGFHLVNRIDQDTSGLVVLARGELKAALSAAFASDLATDDDGSGESAGEVGASADEGVVGEPAVEKVYDALVEGVPDPLAGTIDAPLAGPGHGTRARIDRGQGKPSFTAYVVTELFEGASRVRVTPRTGRTHQIRVHLAHLGTPLLVDPLYGRRKGLRLVDPKGGPPARLSRTPLHAAELSLVDPRTGERRTFRAPLLDDHRRALEVLRVLTARSRPAQP